MGGSRHGLRLRASVSRRHLVLEAPVNILRACPLLPGTCSRAMVTPHTDAWTRVFTAIGNNQNAWQQGNCSVSYEMPITSGCQKAPGHNEADPCLLAWKVLQAMSLGDEELLGDDVHRMDVICEGPSV